VPSEPSSARERDETDRERADLHPSVPFDHAKAGADENSIVAITADDTKNIRPVGAIVSTSGRMAGVSTVIAAIGLTVDLPGSGKCGATCREVPKVKPVTCVGYVRAATLVDLMIPIRLGVLVDVVQSHSGISRY
jgi:hypothetical protein